MPAVYAAADVYVMPSVTTRQVREPWGLGVNEAMCQRLPVVVTDAVGAAAGGLAVHRETALVVPEREATALGGAFESCSPIMRSLGSSRPPATSAFRASPWTPLYGSS